MVQPGPGVRHIIASRSRESTAAGVTTYSSFGRLVRALHMHGVADPDVRDANVSFDKKTWRVTVLDFDQTLQAGRSRLALAPLVPQEDTA